jgi:hypothetical protein
VRRDPTPAGRTNGMEALLQALAQPMVHAGTGRLLLPFAVAALRLSREGRLVVPVQVLLLACFGVN